MSVKRVFKLAGGLAIITGCLEQFGVKYGDRVLLHKQNFFMAH